MNNYQKPSIETINLEVEGAILKPSFDGGHVVGGEGGDPNNE